MLSLLKCNIGRHKNIITGTEQLVTLFVATRQIEPLSRHLYYEYLNN